MFQFLLMILTQMPLFGLIYQKAFEKPLSQKGYKLPGKEEIRSLLIVELENFVLCCTHLSLTESDRK